MLISDFDYTLPEELIAQHPLEQRDAARMLVVNRQQKIWRDDEFAAFPSYIRSGDIVVLNNTRVFPARLIGSRQPSGGQVELFLVRELEPLIWETLARPARRLKQGARATFGEGRLNGEVVEVRGDGRRAVRFECTGSFQDAIDEVGQVPLPPYIQRPEGDVEGDRERYQTVYARTPGAIAAPTAGLHFTPRVMEELKARGAQIVEITLHVGYGTFEPVRVADLTHHKVTPEQCHISPQSAAALNEARSRGNRVFAIGTTTTRALESSIDEDGRVRPEAGMSELTITPGHKFRVVDALLTNFHLPQSSLLVLVGAFAGRELALAAYAYAVEARYRFYSYGDCMLIT